MSRVPQPPLRDNARAAARDETVARSLGRCATWQAFAGASERCRRTSLASVCARQRVAADRLGRQSRWSLRAGRTGPAGPRGAAGSAARGLNVGPNIAATGSLSAFLWWRAAQQVHAQPSLVAFSRRGAPLAVFAIA